MDDEEMVLASEFCKYHDIDLSFIMSLNQSGLIDIVVAQEEAFIPESQLRQLEQLIRLSREMDINMEGIETITYLLQRIHSMQQQIAALNNKLAFYRET